MKSHDPTYTIITHACICIPTSCYVRCFRRLFDYTMTTYLLDPPNCTPKVTLTLDQYGKDVNTNQRANNPMLRSH
jgi:hypothetical protein